MPTYYTEKILNDCSFEEYALSTMRQFGACIMLRDKDGEINPTPENVAEDEGHYKNALKEAEDRLALTDDELLKEFRGVKRKAIERASEKVLEHQIKREKLLAMLDAVKSYNIPSDDHRNWHTFMISQIKESLAFDCYPEDELMKEVDDALKMTATKWLASERESQRWSVEYNKDQLNKLRARNKDRSQWVSQALESLGIDKDRVKEAK